MTQERDDRRNSERIQPFVAPCRVVAGERRLLGFLLDLSRQGARVSCDGSPPAVGSRIVVEVRLGRRVSHSRLAGTVIWAAGGERPTFGLSFQDLAPGEALAVDEVIEEFRRLASAL